MTLEYETDDRTYIYVGEIYDEHGNRLERIAHTTRDGAQEDIDVHANGMDEDVITNITPIRLWGGPDGTVTEIKTTGDDK